VAVHAMAASLGLNPEAFFNPCSSYSTSSPFMAADFMPSFPASGPLDCAAFSTELDQHRLFDFEYSPAASTFTDAGSGDHDHNEKKMYVFYLIKLCLIPFAQVLYL
jgi:hypothetical protein